MFILFDHVIVQISIVMDSYTVITSLAQLDRLSNNIHKLFIDIAFDSHRTFILECGDFVSSHDTICIPESVTHLKFYHSIIVDKTRVQHLHCYQCHDLEKKYKVLDCDVYCAPVQADSLIVNNVLLCQTPLICENIDLVKSTSVPQIDCTCFTLRAFPHNHITLADIPNNIVYLRIVGHHITFDHILFDHFMVWHYDEQHEYANAHYNFCQNHPMNNIPYEYQHDAIIDKDETSIFNDYDYDYDDEPLGVYEDEFDDY